MSFLFDPGLTSAFLQVVVIDLVLAGDNAVVIGLAAASLPAEMRRKAIIVGIGVATLMRILLALVTVHLLALVGLLLAGGILLLWVGWKMWQELRADHQAQIAAQEALEEADLNSDGVVGTRIKAKSFGQAITQIIVADLSMSLDNVLAVAGAAREHEVALAFGLVLSIALMGFAASLIARLLNRYRWIAYLGLAIIFGVAIRMIFEGAEEVWAHSSGLAFVDALF